MMTSVGRGRGWGSFQDKGVPLRRPGESSSTLIAVTASTSPVFDLNMENIITAVQGINLHDTNNSGSTLQSIEEQLKNQCQTEENLRNVVQRLHDRSLEDRQFGMKAAAAYATVSSLEVGSVKLRNVLLQAVQKDFENRTHLQTACHSKFLNAISLLGEIFHRVRLPDGSPINILATAVLQYQDILLAGEEHEMELFTTQLAVNGRKLYDCRAAELEELMLRVRSTLMSRNLSGQCRCWLLLALDLAANRYAPLSGQLQSFYQVHLGANAIMQLQRVQLNLSIEVTSSCNASSTGKLSDTSEIKNVEGDGILAKCKQSTEQTKENGIVNYVKFNRTPDSAKRTSGDGQGIKKVTSPIEERLRVGFDGTKSGGGGKKFGEDKGRRKSWGQKKDDNKNEDIWGSSRGEKSESWGHDDRFVKDDDFYGKQAQRGEGASRPRNRDSTSGNWRVRKSSEGKDNKIVAKSPKSENAKTEPSTQVNKAAVNAPELPDDEENWD